VLVLVLVLVHLAYLRLVSAQLPVAFFDVHLIRDVSDLILLVYVEYVFQQLSPFSVPWPLLAFSYF
jgi:hypothetical protein